MLVRLENPVRKDSLPPSGWAPFALGFRPFYLLGALFAATGIPLWVFVYMGKVDLALPGTWWHAHEMVFGFAAAAITGFLFTAGRNWTGLPTPTGKALALLTGLWLVARLLMLLEGGPWAAAVDAAFLPLVAVVLARLLWRGNQSWRNYFIPALVGGLALANLGFHLARFGLLALDPLRPVHAALGLLVLLETVIAGRITPGFTAAAIKGVWQRRSPALDIATIVATSLALLAWPLALSATPWLAAVAAVLHLLRAAGWNPWAARRQPLLWILHLAYAWVPLGLLLIVAGALGWVPVSAAIHAFGIGATGGLIIGMITRTAIGHTGRTMQVGAVETTAYACVMLAALARVGSQVLWPQWTLMGIHVAATLWAVAFALYLYRYLPWLLRPRVDGQPG